MNSLLSVLLLIAYSTALERHFSPIDAQQHHISRRWADPKGSELNLNPGNPVHAGVQGIQPQVGVFAARPIRAVASQREEEVRNSLEGGDIRQRRHDFELKSRLEERNRPSRALLGSLEENQSRPSRDVRKGMSSLEEVLAFVEQEPRPSRAVEEKRPSRNAIGMQGRVNELEKKESRPSRDVKKELSSLEEAVQDSIDLDRSLDRPVREAEHREISRPSREALVKEGLNPADRQTRDLPNMAPIQARQSRSSFSSPNNNEGNPGSVQSTAKSLRGERHAPFAGIDTPIQHRVVREMENWSHVNPSQPEGVMHHREARKMEHFPVIRPAEEQLVRQTRKDIWKAGMMDAEERTRRMALDTHIGTPVQHQIEERPVRHVASSRFMPISPQNGKRSTSAMKLGILDHQGQGA